jgi:drug/metabolite transporter (DMT)-like permease
VTTAPSRTLGGVLFLVVATACFVVLDSTVKIVGATFSVLIAVWFRYLFQAVAMAGLVLPTRGWASLRTQHPWLQALRGLLLLLVSVLSFWSLRYMPVGEFTAILMLTPLMVVLLAAVFLHEKVTPLRWLLVLGGFSGALLVVQPTGAAVGWVTILPLGIVVSYAAFQILTSRLARTEHALTMHFYTGWVGVLALSLGLPWFWEAIPGITTFLQLCLIGLMGTVGHFLLIIAFGRSPAGVLAPFLYTQVGFAMLAGWLVFDHVPGPPELMGVALIVGCGATSAWLAARR